jgi:methionyl-tRNA formyltransferase
MTDLIIIGSFTPLQKLSPVFLEDKTFRIRALFLDTKIDLYVLKKATNFSIPVHDINILKTEIGEALIQSIKPSWIFNINSTVILSSVILKSAIHGVLNLHPGPLPEYAGLHINQWAIRNREPEFGATLHFVTEGIDMGDIVYQNRFPLDGTETGLSLFLKTLNVGVNLVKRALNQIKMGNVLPRTKQDFSIRKLYKNKDSLDGQIRWHQSALEIEAFIRAVYYKPFKSPTYQPSARINGKSVYIDIAKCVDSSLKVAVGEIIYPNENDVWVGTGDGLLLLIHVSDENGTKVTFSKDIDLNMDLVK